MNTVYTIDVELLLSVIVRDICVILFIIMIVYIFKRKH